MASLDAKLERALAAAPPAAPREEAVAPASTAAGEAGLLERLGAIEKLLGEMRSAGDELEVARLKEEREERLRAEDGYIAADELLAEKKHALAGSAYLKFLEHHPGHPEARDLMGKARDAFLGAGYAEKAFAIHREMMEKFPAERDKDLMSLAMMEKDSRRLDDAIQHAGEAAELARIEEDKVWRLMYRAWFVQLRDGDAAGLQAYRQVEQLIEQLSMGEKNPGRKVKERIAEVEARLARGR
jgi:tetratricopeptide (TPR) repeat protein